VTGQRKTKQLRCSDIEFIRADGSIIPFNDPLAPTTAVRVINDMGLPDRAVENPKLRSFVQFCLTTRNNYGRPEMQLTWAADTWNNSRTRLLALF
jgi:hypothetical protein